MAKPILHVAETIFANPVVANKYKTLDACVDAVRKARCKADHPDVWGTTVAKALKFHGVEEAPVAPVEEKAPSKGIAKK